MMTPGVVGSSTVVMAAQLARATEITKTKDTIASLRNILSVKFQMIRFRFESLLRSLSLCEVQCAHVSFYRPFVEVGEPQRPSIQF